MIHIKRRYNELDSVTTKGRIQRRYSNDDKISFVVPKLILNREQELRDLVHITFVSHAPQGRSIPTIFSDVVSGKIDLRPIAENEDRFQKTRTALKLAWTDSKIYGEVRIGNISLDVESVGTDNLDRAIESLYKGTNPWKEN